MTDRPIIFSAPMVRALLAGTKTQTRRVLKPQPQSLPQDFLCQWHIPGKHVGFNLTDEQMHRLGPQFAPYAVGDHLYVREQHSLPSKWVEDPASVHIGHVFYPASADAPAPSPWLREKPADHGKLRPSIHMPRWASRMTLTVTEVRVQQLQEISAADALAEGIAPVMAPNGHVTYQVQGMLCGQTPERAYRLLWESLHGDGSWEANPWVVAISFTVAQENIDEVPQ